MQLPKLCTKFWRCVATIASAAAAKTLGSWGGPMLPARSRYHSFPKVSWSVSGHSRRGPQRVMDANEKVVSQFDCGDRFVDPVRKRNGIRAANATVPIESLFFRFPILQVGIN